MHPLMNEKSAVGNEKFKKNEPRVRWNEPFHPQIDSQAVYA
jgi:hypothetical protein